MILYVNEYGMNIGGKVYVQGISEMMGALGLRWCSLKELQQRRYEEFY